MAKDKLSPDDYKCLTVVGTIEGERTILRIGIWQYKAYPPKLKVYRIGTRKKDGTEYTMDMGSLTADEAEALVPLLTNGAKALRKALG